jgi:hypothetical protein
MYVFVVGAHNLTRMYESWFRLLSIEREKPDVIV